MRQSRIKRKLARGEPVLITCLHLLDPAVYEQVAIYGFDGIWIDMEHHGTSVQTATTLMRAARVGDTDIVARPGNREFTRMQRILEAGAQGIMYPRCADADEARQVIQWTKFSPLGKRGFDGGNPDMPYCMMEPAEYVVQANQETFVIIQLEEQCAIDRADEIAAVDGVDVLMFGPGDFSILSGIPGQFDHRLIHEAREKITTAAATHGKHWGQPCGTPNEARELMDQGARVLFRGSDITTLKLGLEKIQAEFLSLGFTFEKRDC